MIAAASQDVLGSELFWFWLRQVCALLKVASKTLRHAMQDRHKMEVLWILSDYEVVIPSRCICSMQFALWLPLNFRALHLNLTVTLSQDELAVIDRVCWVPSSLRKKCSESLHEFLGSEFRGAKDPLNSALTYQGSGEPKEPILKHFDNFQAFERNLETTNSQSSSFFIMRISRRPTTREFSQFSYICFNVLEVACWVCYYENAEPMLAR